MCEIRISRISAHQVQLPVKGGVYRMSMGKVISEVTTTVVHVETNTGISWFGEVCPLGSNYLPAFAKGVIPGLEELAPQLLGHNPIELGKLNLTMDSVLKGHSYIKSPIDVACWDVFGKVVGQPLHLLLGGCYQKKLPLYFSLSSDTKEQMISALNGARSMGYKQFQIKCIGDLEDDLERISSIMENAEPGELFIADANQGWSQLEAVRLSQLLKNYPFIIEQPCETLSACLAVRDLAVHALKLDESVHDLESLIRAMEARAMDVVCIKISKLGGITKARQLRDLCASRGISMTIEDTWGSDIVTAALSHLAASTPAKTLLNCCDLNRYLEGEIAEPVPLQENGFLPVSESYGLGVEPNWQVLGDPVFECAI